MRFATGSIPEPHQVRMVGPRVVPIGSRRRIVPLEKTDRPILEDELATRLLLPWTRPRSLPLVYCLVVVRIQLQYRSCHPLEIDRHEVCANLGMIAKMAT